MHHTSIRMNIIVIISVVAIFIINYKFIDIIYDIAEPTAKNSNKTNICANENKKIALLFGDSNLCREISDLLNQYNVSTHMLYDISELDQSFQYDYLVAVNEFDLENLTICSLGLKMMEIKFVLALCNKKYNQKIYKDNKIPYLTGINLTASDYVYKLLDIHNNKEA